MFSYAPVNNFSQQKNDSNQSSIPRYSSPPVKSSASQYNDKQEEYRAMYKHPITRFFFGPGRLFVVKPWKDKGWFVVQLILRADGDFAWRIIGICYPFYDFKSTQPVDIVPLKNNEWFYRDDFFLPGAIFNKSLEINQYICSLVPRKTNAKPTFSKSGWKFFSSICTSTVKYGAYTLTFCQPTLEELHQVATKMTPEQIIAQYSDNHTNTRGLVSTKDIRDRFHSISQSSDVISPNPQYWSNNVEFGQKTKFDEADLDQSITWKRLSSYLENSGYVGHPPPHIAYQPEMYDQDATNENDHYMMHI